MKKFYMVLAAMLTLLCAVSTAQDFTVGGIAYNILSSDEKTVEVTAIEGGYEGEITIPTQVTYGNVNYSVTSIGERAFWYCSELTSIAIPGSVTTIGNNAFEGCSNLASVTLEEGLVSIGMQVFYTCGKLASITIPKSVTYIGGQVFYACSGLESITVAEGNSVYDSRDNCNAIIETATGSLKYGCNNSFIPDGITSISDYSFFGCSGLTNIEIPNSVTSIGQCAFWMCSGLKKLTIGSGVSSIGTEAFRRCSGLESITVDESNSVYDSRNNCNAIIDSWSDGLICGCKNTIIPNGVTSIGSTAFEYCDGLTSITIPASVTDIEYAAFMNCENLATVTSLIPADKLFVPDIDAFVSSGSISRTLYVPKGAKDTYAATDGWRWHFENIVELEPNTFDLTVSSAGYATLYLDYAVEIPDGVNVYTAGTIDGNRLKMQQVTGILPANTGVIVKAPAGIYTFVESYDAADAIEGNLLTGTTADTYIPAAAGSKYYVLSMLDGVVGMYEAVINNGQFFNNANKAYMVLDEESLGIYDENVDTSQGGSQLSAGYRFDFDGTTAIESVVKANPAAYVYDLSGRRVENPIAGIYIVNGKKMLIK